jgi:hypothetical protein
MAGWEWMGVDGSGWNAMAWQLCPFHKQERVFWPQRSATPVVLRVSCLSDSSRQHLHPTRSVIVVVLVGPVVGSMLRAVTITSDVYFGCVAHALTTEREEIMGLLLGDIDVRPSCNSIDWHWC